MRNILLFKGSCAACSKVTRIVISLQIPGLEVRSIDSPEVAEILTATGIEKPTRPALLVVDDRKAEVLVGWAMRRRLATRLIGMRRPAALVRLSVVEWEAGVARYLGPAGPSQRRPAGRALARIGALVLLPSAASQPPEPANATPALTPASQADVQRALDSAQVQAAIRSWGQVRPDVYEVASGSDRALMFTHERGSIATFALNLPAAPNKTTALGMEILSGDAAGVRFYTVDGTPLANLTQSGTAIKGSVAAPPEITPELTREQIKLFIVCCETKIDASCVQTCLGCIGGGLGGIVNCAHCAVCAGVNGVKCAFDYL